MKFNKLSGGDFASAVDFYRVCPDLISREDHLRLVLELYRRTRQFLNYHHLRERMESYGIEVK